MEEGPIHPLQLFLFSPQRFSASKGAQKYLLSRNFIKLVFILNLLGTHYTCVMYGMGLLLD